MCASSGIEKSFNAEQEAESVLHSPTFGTTEHAYFAHLSTTFFKIDYTKLKLISVYQSLILESI